MGSATKKPVVQQQQDKPIEIYNTFLARAKAAENEWKPAFQRIVNAVQALCKQCTTSAQFDHYCGELALFAAFMQSEIDTLIYGVVRVTEIEKRDASMICNEMKGSFNTDDVVKDVDRNRKLSLCSVAGLTYLVKMAKVFHFPLI